MSRNIGLEKVERFFREKEILEGLKELNEIAESKEILLFKENNLKRFNNIKSLLDHPINKSQVQKIKKLARRSKYSEEEVLNLVCAKLLFIEDKLDEKIRSIKN